MSKKNLLIPVMLMLVLSSCATPTADNTTTSAPSSSESSSSDTPDVLVPVDAAVESVIEQDVSATKQQVDTYILTNSGISSIPDDLIVNSQSRIADISVVINDNNTYTVTGVVKNGDFTYQLSGQTL